MTKCTASWEPSDVSFQSNKALKMGGDHFTPPPYQTRVNISSSECNHESPVCTKFVPDQGLCNFLQMKNVKEIPGFGFEEYC